MASQTQDDPGTGGTQDYVAAENQANYPDYDKDKDLFAQFLREHQILTVARRDDDDEVDDDENDGLLEPTSGSETVRRVFCFLSLFQRIKDRHFYNNSNTRTFIVEIPLDELVAWKASAGADLAHRASQNALRYQELFSNVIDQALDGLQPSEDRDNRNANNNNNNNIVRDPLEILQEQRVAQQAARQAERHQNENNGIHNHYAGSGNLHDETNNNNNGAGGAAGSALEELPAVLLRCYELHLLPLGRSGTQPPFHNQYKPSSSSASTKNTTDASSSLLSGVSLRSVRSRSMGRLVTVRGMIVRSSDVRPCCVVAAYACDACGAEIYQPMQNQREFMPIRYCPSTDCKLRGSDAKRETLYLQTRGSKFTKFQELRLQELPNQVPMGHVPRSMSVYCRGELTRVASPGDIVTIDGVFLPQRLAESGFRAMKAGLITTTYLEAHNIIVHKKSYDESLLDSLSQEESNKVEAEILEIATGDDPVGKLSASIAPEIFGHQDIKRSLLLMLVGGCTRSLPDGMRIRGDINICLMGDPGVAKSQLLKHVASIAPRGVYTTGKGSSGVGLTAAVTKDMATGEMSLEGGALVLADRGVCAIDEFDKMDEADRTAIHEVMEQQTVSIAKAGIVATLNARSAVLAAANPLYGRYNRSKSLSENVNLPNSLLSRFDLLFLVLDVADVDKDMALARHVTFVHQNEGLNQKKDENDGSDDEDEDMADQQQDDNKEDVVPPRLLREYIARARRHQPVMPPDVAPYVVEAYVSLRMQDRPGARGGGRGQQQQSDQTVMTARQLLSILRLSQALARLRFSDYVAREDVDEAIRLTHMSKGSLLDDDDDNGIGGRKRGRGEDNMSKIFNIIRDYSTVSGSKEVELKLCEAMVLRKGFTAQQLQSCLEEYETLEVIQINRNRTHVYFL